MRVWLHVRLQQRRVPAVPARQLPAAVGADQVRRGRNTCPAVYNCTRATCCCLFILTVHVCSCWPCPANTTTDGPGAASLDMCKSHSCPFYAKEGVGIMESPNYPRQFPVITVKILCLSTKNIPTDWCGVPVARVPGPHPARAADLAAAGAAPGLLRLLHGVQVGVTL